MVKEKKEKLLGEELGNPKISLILVDEIFNPTVRFGYHKACFSCLEVFMKMGRPEHPAHLTLDTSKNKMDGFVIARPQDDRIAYTKCPQVTGLMMLRPAVIH